MTVGQADTMPDGWQRWLDWQQTVNPDNATEIDAVRGDAGRTLGYIRVVATRTQLHLDPPISTIATTYEPRPHLRTPPGPEPG